ncbi:MAG: hypothetical protein R3E88_19515 [Myxococcota bacterium]|nr:hypothetical protein [Myxococcales bacterium]
MKPSPPIYSDFDEDLSMRDVVESFVIGLAERVDGLQDGEMAGDFGAISRAAGELAAAAREAGYPSIVDAAERVATASAARAGDEARKAIVELTELAQRVRRGSRGAA